MARATVSGAIRRQWTEILRARDRWPAFTDTVKAQLTEAANTLIRLQAVCNLDPASGSPQLVLPEEFRDLRGCMIRKLQGQLVRHAGELDAALRSLDDLDDSLGRLLHTIQDIKRDYALGASSVVFSSLPFGTYAAMMKEALAMLQAGVSERRAVIQALQIPIQAMANGDTDSAVPHSRIEALLAIWVLSPALDSKRLDEFAAALHNDMAT